MLFLKSLKCDLSKSILNIGFLGCVILTAFLCFTSKVYVDPSTAKSYSVIEAIFIIDKQLKLENYSFSSYSVFCKGFNGYLSLFMPVISAIPFIIPFTSEGASGMKRFVITRTGVTKYYLSKVVSVLFCGGLIACLGYAFYGLAVRFLFPSLSSYDLDYKTMELIFVTNKNELTSVITLLVSAFLYGAESVALSLIIFSFSYDPYLITCIPFILIYTWQTSLQKITKNLIDKERFDIANVVYDMYPSSVMSLNVTATSKDIKIIIIFTMALIVFCSFFYITVMHCRTDKGE